MKYKTFFIPSPKDGDNIDQRINEKLEGLEKEGYQFHSVSGELMDRATQDAVPGVLLIVFKH